jgi:hypothetical protein
MGVKTEKSKIKALLVSGESCSLLLWWHQVAASCRGEEHCIFIWQKGQRVREYSLQPLAFLWVVIPLMRADVIISQKTHLLILFHWELIKFYHEFWRGYHHSNHNSVFAEAQLPDKRMREVKGGLGSFHRVEYYGWVHPTVWICLLLKVELNTVYF